MMLLSLLSLLCSIDTGARRYVNLGVWEPVPTDYTPAEMPEVYKTEEPKP